MGITVKVGSASYASNHIQATRKMNDPHVFALHYSIEHAASIDYSMAAPDDFHERAFDIHVENKDVRFTMKVHFATEHDARHAVEDFIHGWELDATLGHGPNAFKLRFNYADIRDRSPTPGVVSARGKPIEVDITLSKAQGMVSPPRYPSPPSTGLKRSPDVESMLNRYVGYCQGKEPLTGMAYFCLTVLTASTTTGARQTAAHDYQIDRSVLDRLGELSSSKGGTGARKAEGVHQELTPEEHRFVEEVIKTIIRRAAELAHDPNTCLKQITLSHLPTI